jgi:hypothetical protein
LNLLPASHPGPLSIAAPLYHKRDVPLVCPLEAATRTDNLKLNVSPAPNATEPESAIVIVLSTALLNPLLPPGTSFN